MIKIINPSILFSALSRNGRNGYDSHKYVYRGGIRTFFSMLIAAVTLGACSTMDTSPQGYYKKKNIDVPAISSFPFCSEYGCKKVEKISLSEEDWRDILEYYGDIAVDAESEREKISRTIGLFERKIGRFTGTDSDVYGTFHKMGKGQLDCVDESTNTTTYLMLLDKYGLLKFHYISMPDVRIPIIHYMGRWPHQTAVIIEKGTGVAYAVDSWFHDNGYAAEVVPLKKWKEGWKPEKHLRRGSDL